MPSERMQRQIDGLLDEAEAAHGLRFSPHADDAVGVEAIRFDQREGDVAVELGVVGEIDALLGAFAQEGADVVAAGNER